MRRAATLLVAAAALAAAATTACGPVPAPLRFRHVAGTKLVYRLHQEDVAEDPFAGLGGKLATEARLTLACLGVGGDGAGEYEVSVDALRMTAPQGAGIAVDTSAKGPVPGDRVGANAVVLSLLPRHAVVTIGEDGIVRGAQSDAEVAQHVGAWARLQPLAAQGPVRRLTEALDPGPLVVRWFHPFASTLPSDPFAAPGTRWPSSPPPVNSPGGRLRASLEVVHERDGAMSILRGRGTFAADPAKDASAEEPLVAFEDGTVETTTQVDSLRGLLVAYEERGILRFRGRGPGGGATSWTWTRWIRLEE